MLSEQQQRIMGYFIEEAKDHLNTIEQGLLNLRATIDDPEMVNEVFRAAHSVKGGAAMLGLTSIQHTAHRLEDYFKLLKECQVAIDQKLETLLLRVYDTLQDLLEQLQGPFGLTDDKAEAAMAGVEPVFAELNQHLSQLVAESGITPPDDVNLSSSPVAEPVAAQASVPLTEVTPEASALRFIFQNDIPARLREMLQLFKQPDTVESRQQLSRLCQVMAQPGDQLDLPDWCRLLETAERAISNPDISYRMLAPVVIKDLKRAQEQILAGDLRTAASPELLAMLPLDQESLNVTAAGDERALSEEPIAFDSDFDLPVAAIRDSDLNLDADPIFATDEDDLAFERDLLGQDEASGLFDTSAGPEVGSAELNSLADLFEGEDNDLGLNWQEEILPASGELGSEPLELNAENDFSDLLFQENADALVLNDGDDDLSALLEQSSLEASARSESSDLADVDFGATTDPGQDHNMDFFDLADSSTDLDLTAFDESIQSGDSTNLDDLFSAAAGESNESFDLGTVEFEPGAFDELNNLDLGADAALDSLNFTDELNSVDAETSNLFDQPDQSVAQPALSDAWGESATSAAQQTDSDLSWNEDPFAELADGPAAANPENLFNFDPPDVAEPEFTADLMDLGFGADEPAAADLNLSEPIDLTALGEETELDLNWEETLDSGELSEFHLDEPGPAELAEPSAESFDASAELTDLDFNQFADSNSADLDLFGEETATPFEATEVTGELSADLNNLFAGDLTAGAEPVPSESVNLAEFELPEDFVISDEVIDIAALAEGTAASDADLMDLSLFDSAAESEFATAEPDSLFEAEDQASRELNFGSPEPPLEMPSDFGFDLSDAPSGDPPSGESELGLGEFGSDPSDAGLSLDFGDESAEALGFGVAESGPDGLDGGLDFIINHETSNDLDFGLAEPSSDANRMLNFGDEPASDLSFDPHDTTSLQSDFNVDLGSEVTNEPSEPLDSDSLDLSELATDTADSDLNFDFATEPAAEAAPNFELAFGDEASAGFDQNLTDLSIEPTAESTWPFDSEASAAESALSFDDLDANFDKAGELNVELNFEATPPPDSDLNFDLGAVQPSEAGAAMEAVPDLSLNFETLDFEAEPSVAPDSELQFDSADLDFDLGTAFDRETPVSESADAATQTDLDDFGLNFGDAATGEFEATSLFESTDSDSDTEAGLFDTPDSETSELNLTGLETPTADTDLNLDRGEVTSSDLDFGAFEADQPEVAESDLGLNFEADSDVDWFGDETELLGEPESTTVDSNLDFDQPDTGMLDFAAADSEFESELGLGSEFPDSTDELGSLNFDQTGLDLGEPVAADSDLDRLNFESDLNLDLGDESAAPAEPGESDFARLDGPQDTEATSTQPEDAGLDLGLAAGLAGLGAAGFAAFNADHQPEDSNFDFGDFNAEPTDLSFETAPETDELDNLDALLAESETAEPAPFDDLEAVLAEETPAITAIHEDPEDDFADLEALLEDESLPGAASVIPVSAPAPAMPISSPPQTEDEFSDLEAMLQDADQVLGGGTSPARKSASAAARRPNRRSSLSDQTMRVSVKHLDNLNNLVGEMVVNRNSLEQAQERLRQFLDNLLYQVQQLSDVGQRMRDLYERSLLESSLLSGRRGQSAPTSLANIMAGQTDHATGHSFDALEMDRFTGFHTLSQEMIELIVRVRESASDIDFVVEESDQVTRNFRQITTQLQEGLTRSRMVPFSQTADRLPRGVRDNSLKYGKQAELIIEGRDTLIDKMIVELLYDPMTHLVNNAIAHGIETPEERIAAGKSPTGQIVIRAFHQGNQTVISVSDDGAGINPEAVRAKALAKGVISATQAREMSRLDTYDLLFHHGFSTVDQVDDLRGRGVGLDVVRSNLNEIRGTISIDSTIGKGTTFTIRLPLTLSISKALCCISNRARIAFPMDGVEDMLDVPKERVQTDEQGRACIQWRDQLLPFQPLSDLLRHNRVLGRGSVYGGNQEEDMISIVVLRSAGNFLALQVDQVLGEQEIVIKQLEGPVPKPLGVAGATVLGDGRIMPIADVLELIDLWQGRVRREAGASLWDMGDTQAPVEATTKSEPTVLIVDDSITVRELLSMTFSKVGYRVEQARDGQEAWEKLRSGLPCDLVFCDIEMPRMDGLELLSRIQRDPNLNHLPIAMLTSRGADRHRQMAVQLGAKGYFTKPYLEEMLLDAAQRMLKGEVMVSS